MTRRIKIQFKIGAATVNTDKDSFPHTKCHLCKKDIYFVKANGMKKIIATKVNDENYILHNFACDVLVKREQNKKNRKRRYEKNNQTNKKSV